MNLTQEAVRSQNLDHLGLVAALCQDLDIADRINQLLGASDSQRDVSAGTCVVAMILNGLGRTLDEIAAYGSTTLFANIAFPLALENNLLSKLNHIDTTGFKVHGDYESDDDDDNTQDTIEVAHGYSKDHRPDLNKLFCRWLSMALLSCLFGWNHLMVIAQTKLAFTTPLIPFNNFNHSLIWMSHFSGSLIRLCIRKKRKRLLISVWIKNRTKLKRHYVIYPMNYLRSLVYGRQAFFEICKTY